MRARLERRGGGTPGAEYTQGVQTLFALRVVRPTLSAFRINRFTIYAEYGCSRTRSRLGPLRCRSRSIDAKDDFERWAEFDVCVAMTIQGVSFAELTQSRFCLRD